MDNDGMTWDLAFFLVGSLAVLTTAGIVIAWQIFATWRAKMSVAREDAYRQLAAEATEAQRRTASELERAAFELQQLRATTAELERMLKEVG
ncbi:MAG: hypothetical protein ACM3S1_08145 [Hyphomicrobiales bacterium]